MHSITESDGVPSDPYEVLCHMAALIIEGRTPLHISKGIGDSSVSGETAVGKPPRPYHEGPHCPNFMKLFNKESANIHKCSENNVLCIRFNKLKQHLLHLFEKSVPITVEVSLGPDCLCGELRSQSTLVSGTPCRRDIVLEQWTIGIANRRGHELSQMSVMNLYQAVRSLLHFSQLTAWYMTNNGMKPAHIIYRVGVPGDSAFVSDENFVKHDFPTADINKGVSLKMSVKSAPRMENIPSVYCPQHLCGHMEGAQSIHQETKDFSRLNKEKKCLGHGINSKLVIDEKEDLSDLLLKFQGARKKICKAQERKDKNRLSYFGSPPSYGIDSVKPDLCDCLEYLDTIALEKKPTKSKSLLGVYNSFGNTKVPYLKSQHMGNESSVSDKILQSRVMLQPLEEMYTPNFFESKFMKMKKESESDQQMKEGLQKKPETCSMKGIDILDDRMQIPCAISGKHHCKYEYEEEAVDNLGTEKPRRRRSLGKGRPNEISEEGMMNSETYRILHGKFKDVEAKPCTVTLKTVKRSIQNESSKWTSPDFPVKKKSLKSLTDYAETKATSSAQTECLPLTEKEIDSTSDFETDSCSSEDETWRKDRQEKGEVADGEIPKKSDEMSTEERENDSDEDWESSTNPFMAAILRTTKKFKQPKEVGKEKEKDEDKDKDIDKEEREKEEEVDKGEAAAAADASEGTQKACDNSQNNLYKKELDKNEKNNNNNNCDYPVDKEIDNDIFLHKSKQPAKSNDVTETKSDKKTKVVVPEEGAHSWREFAVPMDTSHARLQSATPTVRCRHRMKLDLRLEERLSAVRNLSSFGNGECPPENSGPSEFISRSLNRLKSLFDKREFARENDDHRSGEELCRADLYAEDNGGCNGNNTKTISVPSAQEKLKFRRSLDTAAQLVFHRCSGLPLTSSPAPVRRNNSSFSFDSSLNSVSAIKSALFDSANSISSEDENESEGSLRSPASPGALSIGSKSINYHSLSPLPLLGTFEESVLNGRLEPVSTVQGFTAELGASGSFCPRHLYLPVTVFFYTLGDNDKVSAPYLGHINLGKKGYSVPRSGTIQVTLFNPMRTVVKMFVVVYDLHDMPPNSHTFLRQRTLYVPADQRETIQSDEKNGPFEHHEDYHKYLRYLIHLRFISGKTGRIYLHTDIRMIIFRKSDEDTATALGRQVDGETFELRSHTHGPTNPKFSPRK